MCVCVCVCVGKIINSAKLFAIFFCVFFIIILLNNPTKVVK